MPAPRTADRRFLERHGNKWRVVVSVPRDLQEALGRTKLKQSLPTDSLAEANRLKWPVVDRLERRIAEHREPTSSHDRALKLAAMRRDLEADGGDVDGVDHVIFDEIERLAGPPIEDHEGQPVYDPKREQAAQAFAGVALGQRTPISVYREVWLTKIRNEVKPRTVADDERALGYLLRWCKANSVPPFLETFGKREAARFVDDFGNDTAGLSPVTLNKYVRRLSQFWKWLVKRDAAPLNVWDGQTYTVPRTLREDQERPFNDAEMVRLLAGPASQQMHDLMRIAALTGARIEPIVDLRVSDCSNGVFTFKAQKREPGARQCPIHSDLVEIIERRTEGKEPGDDVFPEWPPVRKQGSTRERSFKASNHFTDYRRSVGVDDRRPGKRRSLINFHSFRRWFITKAEQAGQPESTIQAVVGHKRPGMTFGVYSGGPTVAEQMRQCVEAVRLPTW